MSLFQPTEISKGIDGFRQSAYVRDAMNELNRTADIIVIGAGIVGASVAYELAHRGMRVCMAEMENHPGYHTTGRSAATYVGCYGNETIRAISAASRPFFVNPPPGFCSHPLLAERGALYVAGQTQLCDLDAFVAEPPNEGLLERIDPSIALEIVPVLKTDTLAGAAYERNAQDIDVNALLMGYLKGVRDAGSVLETGAEVQTLVRRAGVWLIETPTGTMSAPIVVNAAGAWGDEVAYRAGAQPVGLVPKRRTALTINPGEPFKNWPLTISLDETWYFRPESGDLLISPADETPSVPCDSQPDELDVATCIDQIERVSRIKVGRLISKRAGLRTFVHDKSPVCGYAGDVDDFFWLVGQGGYGIQTAPALAKIAACLILGEGIGEDLRARGVTEESLGPARLAIGPL